MENYLKSFPLGTLNERSDSEAADPFLVLCLLSASRTTKECKLTFSVRISMLKIRDSLLVENEAFDIIRVSCLCFASQTVC